MNEPPRSKTQTSIRVDREILHALRVLAVDRAAVRGGKANASDVVADLVRQAWADRQEVTIHV